MQPAMWPIRLAVTGIAAVIAIVVITSGHALLGWLLLALVAARLAMFAMLVRRRRAVRERVQRRRAERGID